MVVISEKDDCFSPRLTFERLQARQRFALVLSASPSIHTTVVARRRPSATTAGLCHPHVRKLSILSITLTRLPLRLRLEERKLRTSVSSPLRIDNL